MSHVGWKVVRAIDERYEQGQRRGQVQPWERSRILKGDYSAIVRDVEPEKVYEVEVEEGRKEERPGMVAGAVHVLSWSRPRGSVDEESGEGMKPPPEPLFWIEVRKVVRHKRGHWRVLFDVFDRRLDKRLIRRKPPAMPMGEETDPDPELSRLESAYTGNPKAAIDHLEAVDDETLDRFTKEGRVRLAEVRKQEHAEEQARDDVRRMSRRLQGLVVRSVRLGVDPVGIIATLERDIRQAEEQMRDAA